METGAVPADDGLGLYDDKDVAPLGRDPVLGQPPTAIRKAAFSFAGLMRKTQPEKIRNFPKLWF